MAKPLKKMEILEHLKMLAEWIRVKRPDDYFELVVVGGAAMALEGFKEQTNDIDIIRPEVLPEPIVNGVANIARIRSTEMRKEDLRIVLKDLGFDFDDIHLKVERGDKPDR